MINFLYNLIFVLPAKILLPFFSIFNKKIKKREKSWKNILNNTKIDYDRKKIWFHSASMGEFEQAKSIIESIKQTNPDVFIIVSFFSPSGYENQKNYEFADSIIYLPFDSKKNAKLLLDKLKPDYCVFIRYDVWLNLLNEIKKRKIPALLINATKPLKLNSNFILFKTYLKKVYSLFDEITTVGEIHTDFFKKLLPDKKIQTLTDTRFDRIINQIETSRKNPIISRDIFQKNELILIAGSSWEPDEDIIFSAYKQLSNEFQKKLRLIFVPHEPTSEHIERLSNLCGKSILLSKVIENSEIVNEESDETPIIVDSIGKLLKLYGIADLAYVGGGFGVGIHSVTEPAGYGIPIATGPKINNSPDALNLKKLGALKPVYNTQELLDWFKAMITNNELRTKTGQISKEYVIKNSGSTEIVKDLILKCGIFTEHHIQNK